MATNPTPQPVKRGRPPIYGERMERAEALLPPEAIEFFTALGKPRGGKKGNFSDGVRLAWLLLKDKETK